MFSRVGKEQLSRSVKHWIALAILPASGLFARELTGVWQGLVRNPILKRNCELF